LERLCYIGDDLHEAARFLNRDVFIKIGGFDENLRLHGDEYEVQARLDKMGYKTGRIDTLETHIDEIDSLKEVFLKSFYYGYNSKKYVQKHTSHSLSQLQPFRIAFLRKRHLLAKHPLLTLGLMTFKFVQYSSATTGFILALIGGGKVAEKFHRAIYKK
jgi:GT2 family glycosyltransferase